MTKRFTYALMQLFVFYVGLAQNESSTVNMEFNLQFGIQPLVLNQNYVTQTNDTLQVSRFRCYISGIEFHYFDGTVFKQPDSYHLLDAERPASLKIPVTVNQNKLLSRLVFNIGIDSTTSVSGAMAGDLDPANGMYWAWQSGYINTKIEGKSASCNTRKNEFQFHIGGYLPPHYALRKVALVYDKRAYAIPIAIDLKRFFEQVKLSQTNSVMIPGEQAMQLADRSAKMFYLR